MNAIKILITFWVILLGTNYSNAQTIEATLDESFTGLHTVSGTYTHFYEYNIVKINGGSFTLTVNNSNSGSFTWTPPSVIEEHGDIITTNESGGYGCEFTQTSSSNVLFYDIMLHFKLSIYSTLLNASTGTWTDVKELTLPASVTSVNMNVIASVANNFNSFSWNIENENLSLTQLTGDVPGNSHDVVNINMNGKSQIKIIIKAYDSGASNYESEDYFYIKSSGPTVYNLSGSGSYCEGSSGRTIPLSNSDVGTSYQLKDGSNANVGIAKDGTGSALEWSNITAGSYTVVATNAGGTATMNGTIVITMDPYPGKPVITGDSFVKKGSSAVYTGTASNNPTSWTWVMSPSGLATSTPSGQQTTLNFTGTGTFALTAQATNICGTGIASDGFDVEIVDISAMEAEINQLKTDTLNKGIMYRDIIAGLESDIVTLTSDVNDLLEGIDQLEEDNLALQDALAIAISERDQAIIDRDAALAANVTLTQQVGALTTANATLTQQVTDLTGANTTLTGQLATVTQERDDALEHIDGIATLLDVDVANIEDQIVILQQVYVLSWEVTGVVTSVFETEIGNFSISLYPNPSPGQVFIECTEEIKEVKIFSLQGALIKQFTVNNTETSFVVNRSEMPVGTYIIHIQTTKGTSTHKIIFQ